MMSRTGSIMPDSFRGLRRRIGISLVLTGLGMAPQILPLEGADWNEFRGPSGRGIDPQANPPIQWMPGGWVGWRTPVPGKGWSSPVYQKNRLVLTTAEAGSEGRIALNVLCFDLSNIKLLWKKEVFSAQESSVKHDKNSHASATPYLSEDRIFAHFGPLGTACLDFEGEILWRQSSLGYASVHGNGSSPVLVGDRLIFHADGQSDPAIIALDADSGSVVWKQIRETEATRKFSFSTPLLVRVDGRPEIVSPASGAVFGYSPVHGNELWRVDYGQGYSVVPRPVASEDSVFVASGFGRPKVMSIRLGGRGNLSGSHVNWETSRSGPKTPSMLFFEGRLYFVSDGGIVSSYQAGSGKLVWQDRIKGNVSASPIIAGRRIYLSTEEGRVFVLKTGDQFEVVAQNDMKERIFASPAVDGDALIIRTESHLYRITAEGEGRRFF